MTDGRHSFRLLSYNIRSLRDDRAAVARVVRDSAADVVCFQEAPRFVFPRRSAIRLTARCGLRVATGGRPAAANLIGVNQDVEVLEHRNVLLHKQPRLHQRGVALVRLRVNQQRLVIAGTHLDVTEQARLAHLPELESALAVFAAGDPVVLAGDFNDDPGTATWRELTRRRRDAFALAGVGDGISSSIADPRRRIDAVLVDETVTVHECRSIDSPDVRRASDHRPVLAVLEVG